jgi:hypothetical protein
MLASNAACYGKARAGGRELSGKPLDDRSGQSRLLSCHLRSKPAECGRELRTAAAHSQKNIRHGEGQSGLRARADRVPLVSIQAGEIHTRSEIHELRDFATTESMRFGEAALMLD